MRISGRSLHSIRLSMSILMESGPKSATLASGWESRLRKTATPAMNGAVISGLSPEDLAYAKLAAGREKDIDFVRGMVQHGIVSQVLVGRLIGACPDPQLQIRLSERFTIAVGLTQIGDQHGKKPGLSDPVRRAINEGRGKGDPER